MTAAPRPPRVVLVGMYGHGRVHLDGLLARRRAGLLELAGVADRRAPGPEEARLLHGLPFDTDAVRLLAALRPDVAVLCTPIHTHADLAEQAMLLGAHVLLEKPPVTCVADHERLLRVAGLTGRHCQVGFQAFGSSAARDLLGLVRAGRLGEVRRVAVVGRWRRDAAYYTRAPWAGRRRLGGVVVADGALTNPFAHGVVLALRAADPEQRGPVRAVRVEPWHAYPIETDDTVSARIDTHGGVPVTVAVTLCAAREAEPYVEVHGSAGTARLHYTTDDLTVRTAAGERRTTGDRVELIDDLIARLDADPTADGLLSPLRATRAFTEVLEAVQRGPAPRPIPERYLEITPHGRTVPGIEDAVAEAGVRGLLLSELGTLPWTTDPSED